MEGKCMAGKMQGKGKRVWSVIAASSAILFLAVISFFFMDRNHVEKQGEFLEYHVVFISDDMEDVFWNEIYQETKKYGEKSGIYVENLENVFSEDYTKSDFLDMAVSMKADGIILQGDQSEQTRELIDEADALGIPVITVLDDCEESQRKSYISMGNYDIGCEYARQIQMIENKNIRKILLITSEMMDNTSVNLVYTGLKDMLGEEENGEEIEIEFLNAKNRTIFDIEEQVRQKLISEDDVPDVIICMGEKETISVSRLVVDYNKVNTTKVLGYYTSENVLKAVENGSVFATLAINAKDIAEACVNVFLEYMEQQQVSDYISIDVNTVTKENVEEYRDNAEEGNSES